MKVRIVMRGDSDVWSIVGIRSEPSMRVLVGFSNVVHELCDVLMDGILVENRLLGMCG